MLYLMPFKTRICPSNANRSNYLYSSIVRDNPNSMSASGLINLAGEKLLYCLEKHGVIIVVGQTGCGKTTRKSPRLFARHYWQ